MTKATVVNVVATADLGQKVDLGEMGKIEYALHSDSVYGGRVAYLKTPETKGKVCIFKSGKMISVGTKSREDALNDLTHAMEILVDAGLVEPVPIHMRIRNVVAVANFEKLIDLYEVASKFEKAIYEPEQFPGAICKPVESPDITILLFASGKAVITGLKEPNRLDSIVHKISHYLNDETPQVLY